MERVLSVEEKIKRAEEIYVRRKNNYPTKERQKTTVPVNEKKNLKLFKKMLIQFLICSLIYCIFYLIQDTNYIFSENVINKTNDILSYDTNFNEFYKSIMMYVNKLKLKTTDESTKEEALKQEVVENIQTQQEYQEETLSATDTVVEEKVAEVVEDVKEPKTEMELDAEYVLQNFSVVKPIEGVVSSEFGERESTNPIVTPNHIGIDIAADTGTIIQAAMDGKVTVASYNSSYGNFLKIENGEVMTVYAHCQTLQVKQQDEIKQGQTIATVGSTGNSTGPHLHFEIRRQGRFINPRYIIDFG